MTNLDLQNTIFFISKYSLEWVWVRLFWNIVSFTKQFSTQRIPLVFHMRLFSIPVVDHSTSITWNVKYKNEDLNFYDFSWLCKIDIKWKGIDKIYSYSPSRLLKAPHPCCNKVLSLKIDKCFVIVISGMSRIHLINLFSSFPQIY